MNWEIRIPFKDRSDPVFEIGFAARDFPEDERAIVRKLTMDAIEAGHETVGDLLDELEDLGVAGRRQRLDQARQQVGLEPTAVLDQRREQRRIDAKFSDFDIPGPPPWSPLQSCHAQGCSAWPTGPAGNVIEVSVERYFCPEHEDLAEPGDLEEHEAPYLGIGLNGRPIPSAKEAARIAAAVAARDEPLAEARREREEHLRREGEALEEVRERYGREAEISVAGVRLNPVNLRINQ